MWPYIDTLSHLPGYKVCKFEFFSQATSANEEKYIASRRYRLNHWLPLVDTYPLATPTGLRFEHYHDEPLTGMISPWTVSTGANKEAEVNILVSKYEILDKSDDIDAYLEIGVGFLRYTAPYWLPMNAMKLAVHRKVQAFAEYKFSTLHQQQIGMSSFSTNSTNTSMRFTLKIIGTSLWIDVIEYAMDGATSIANATYNITTEGMEKFHIVFFLRGTKDCSAQATLSKTTFSGVDVMSPKEEIWFPNNPAIFRVPEANIRSAKLPLIQQPHKAFIEDGSLEISSPMTSPLWFNTLKYLVDYTVEPCVFTDVEGNPWLVCLGDLKGDGPSNRRGQIRSGYSLSMPILVIH